MRIAFMLLAVVLCFHQVSWAESPEAEARLNEMKRRVIELDVKSDDVDFVETPLLRYSDEARGVTDATVWRLGKSGRPLGIMVLEYYKTSGVPWNYELTVTSDTIPEAIESPGWTWKPEGNTLPWKKLDAKPPAATKTLIARQVKQLVRDFRVKEEFNNNKFELRLLPKSIASYTDEKAGVVAGEVFSYVHGTNAELLILVEARKQKDGSLNWMANYARLGAARFEVDFKEDRVWDIDYFRGGRGTTYLNDGLLDSPKSLIKEENADKEEAKTEDVIIHG